MNFSLFRARRKTPNGFDLGGRLQIAIKARTIQLDKARPQYNGVWHLEGTPTDRIVACSIVQNKPQINKVGQQPVAV